jgi:hypothetical protein
LGGLVLLGVHPVTEEITIGRCPACGEGRRFRSEGACSECLQRFGARFVVLAVRARGDVRFRAPCRAALPAHLRAAFDVYFGEHRSTLSGSGRR